MNYSEPLFSQFSVFFRSIGVGVLLGIWYIFISFIRTVAGEKRFIYVTADIVFALSSAVVSFMFMVLFNSGKIRFNLVFGEVLGVVSFYFGIGKYILSFLEKWAYTVRKIIRFIFKPVRLFKEKILRKICFIKVKIKCKKADKTNRAEKVKENTEKIFNIGKIYLKNKKI